LVSARFLNTIPELKWNSILILKMTFEAIPPLPPGRERIEVRVGSTEIALYY
jgi:hypothetical protein